MNKKIINNSVINLVTQIIPIFIAIIFIPINIKLLGNDLFGIYSLVVTLLVLFNYLNFGIAPATTKEISKYLALKDNKKVSSIFFNSFIIMFILGLFLSLFFFNFNNFIAVNIIKDDKYIKLFAQLVQLVGFLSPILMLVIFFRSVLEAKQIFIVTSLNRAFLNSIVFIAPICIYFSNENLIFVFKIVIMAYILSVFVLAYFSYKEFIKDNMMSIKIKDSKEIINIGFWMMLSSLAGIGLYYADRFIISSVISIVAVAYYIASYDLVTRLNIISGSLTSALFPAFSHWYTLKENDNIIQVVTFVIKIILFLVGIIAFFLIIFSKELLLFWINQDYSINSYYILQFLTIGVLFNTLSVVPFRTLSAIGFPNIVAIVYIIEMPIFLIVTYFSISFYGLKGAVIAYDIRAFIEVLILYYLLHKKIPFSYNFINQELLQLFSFIIFLFSSAFIIFLLQNIFLKIVIAILCIVLFFVIFYIYLLSSVEKNKILEYKHKIRNKF